jgi:diguanylate cyclase (GGDEF)-like protein
VSAVELVAASSTGTAVAAAVAAALVTLIVGGLWLAFSRGEAPAEQWLAGVVSDLDARIEAMQQELAAAVERAHEEGRRNRFLGEVAGSINLDEVLRRTLDAAAAIPGVDAAAITLLGGDGDPVTSQIGLSAEELEEYAASVALPGRFVRSAATSYDAPDEAENGETPILSALAVPIRSELEPLGVLAVFSRSETAFGGAKVLELEDVAARAGVAIHNARRFREARQLADFDALTGLHNRRYFHETLAREVSRAQRYDRKLGLLVLDLDDLKAINDRLGHLGGDSVLAGVASRIRDVVRSVDIPCRVGGDEFAVILPESTLADAEQLYQRLQAEIAAWPTPHGRLSISGGVAELRRQDDPLVLFQRADEALYRAKQGGKGRAVTASGIVGKSRERPLAASPDATTAPRRQPGGGSG